MPLQADVVGDTNMIHCVSSLPLHFSFSLSLYLSAGLPSLELYAARKNLVSTVSCLCCLIFNNHQTILSYVCIFISLSLFIHCPAALILSAFEAWV